MLQAVPSTRNQPPTPSAEERQLFAELLAAQRRRQRTRNRLDASIDQVEHDYLAFLDGALPWQLGMPSVDIYGDAIAETDCQSTVRRKLNAIKQYDELLHHPGYGFEERYRALTGRPIPRLVTEFNLRRHISVRETSRRAGAEDEEFAVLLRGVLTEIERAAQDGRKGAWTHRRNYAIFHLAAGFGTRNQEMALADASDLWNVFTPWRAAISRFEGFHARFGKRSPGGEYKVRFVPAWRLFGDSCRVLEWYLDDVRPHFLERAADPVPLFLSERGDRLKPEEFADIFARYRDRLSLRTDLSMHCLRHRYAMKLYRAGCPVSVIQALLGHEQESTTWIYLFGAKEQRLRERVEEIDAKIEAERLQRYACA